MKIIATHSICPACRKEIPLDYRGEPTEANGIGIRIGGSEYGWGHRFDNVDFSDEVCNKCFKDLFLLGDKIRERLGIKKDRSLFERLASILSRN